MIKIFIIQSIIKKIIINKIIKFIKCQEELIQTLEEEVKK